MTERRHLVPLLRKLDEERAREGMPLGAQHRVASALRERAQAERAGRGWLPMVTFACGAALVLLVLTFGAWSPAEPPPTLQPVATAPSLGAFSVEGDGCRWEPAGERDAYQLSGPCRLVGSHMTVSSWTGAKVVDQGRSVDVKSGRVLFDVEKVRPADASVTVKVSGGLIEVVGTRFEVDEHESGGHVDLFEGQIRFHEPDGTVVNVLPGTRHAWGDERPTDLGSPEVDEVEVEILDDEPAPSRAEVRAAPRRNSREAAEIIDRVERLRRAGRSREGVALLRQAVADRWDRRTAQVLSYELGELLHRYVGDRAAACDHFAAHQRRFSRGRYRVAVARTLERLQCERSR